MAFGAYDDVKFELNHEPPSPRQRQHHTMSNPATQMTPAQIRRRSIDYDQQIRDGLENGTIRQVVKQLGRNLVRKKKISFVFLYWI